jgi:flagellar motility protein MotE (MotC chaperone)
MAKRTQQPDQITDGKPKKRKGRKILKLLFFMGFLGCLAFGVTYGLAKFGVVRLPQKPLLKPLYAKLGLNSPKLPARVTSTPLPDPLADERKKLQVARDSLAQERADWERQKAENAQREAERKKAEAKSAPTEKRDTTDPKALARLAAVYEEMPPQKVTKILAVLPDAQVIELLKRMDEKRVAELLGEEKPARAARLSLSLVKPVSER